MTYSSTKERLWTYLKDNGPQPIKAFERFGLDKSTIAYHLLRMTLTGELRMEKVRLPSLGPKGASVMKDINHYAVTSTVFKDIPYEPRHKRSKARPQAEAAPPMLKVEPEPLAPLAPAPAPKNLPIDVGSMTVRQARDLYDQLKTIFKE